MKYYTVKDTRIDAGVLYLSLRPQRLRDRLRFYPGQYATIGFKGVNGRPTPLRCFSITSSPNNLDLLQFAVRIQGEFTQAATKLRIGDEVFLQGPFGDFVVDTGYDKNIVMMAGGIGITPFMSMIRFVSEANLPIPMTLLYSCRSQDKVPFYAELMQLQRQNPRLRVQLFITDGPVDKLQETRALKGRMDNYDLRNLTPGQATPTYFVCGPKGFTRNLEGVLSAQNIDPDNIIIESFTQSSKVKAGHKYSISSVVYALTGATLIVGTAFITYIDVSRFLPKYTQAVSAQQNTTSQTTSSSSTPSTSSSSQNYNSSSNSSSSSNTGSNYSQTYNAPSQTQQYQVPVTSVS